MPELPEVEVTRLGLLPHLQNQAVKQLIIREYSLRWPIPKDLKHHLVGATLHNIARRGKYLLFSSESGSLMIHLGMSGSLRLVPLKTPAQKHEHVDIVFADKILRYTDPRRFGAILWVNDAPSAHRLLAKLGPEPLTREFNTNYLYRQCQGRQVNIKTLVMNSHIVVGVGNIYATESLFLAGIHPLTPAGTLEKSHITALVQAIKKVLRKAIKSGGTTLQDFVQADGRPGYFQQKLWVYGRKDMPCLKCNTTLDQLKINGRSTVFCPACQP